MRKSFFAIALLTVACGTNVSTVSSSSGKPDAGPSAPAPALSNSAPAQAIPSTTLKWEVHFSPHGGCTDEVVKVIDGAQASVWVQAYGFTSQQVSDALVRAYARHGADGKPLDVRVILDKSNRTEKASKLSQLTDAHVPTWVDAKHAIAHSKVVLVDGHVVETGSFNYTGAAENSNAENCLVLDDPGLAAKYQENWLAHQAHSDSAD